MYKGCGKAKMLFWLKKTIRNNEGGTLAVFAVALPFLLGAVAVSVETGYWMKSKSDVQMIADMAAFAGAKELESKTNAQAITAATLHTVTNNYDFTSGTIEVNSPPLSGAYAGQDAVEVILVQQGLKFFSGVVSDESIQYRVRAVAAVLKEAEVCALALNTSASDAFVTSGNTAIDFDGCSIGSNSTHADAMSIGNNTTVTADCLYSAGGIDGGTNAITQCSSPQENAPQIADPFADVLAPTAALHPDANWDDPCLTPTSGGGSSMNMVAGRYCSNITVNATYTLAPGTHIFDGMSVKMQGGTLTGTGVTVILINGASIDNINGLDTIIIEAQTSGTYAGLAIFSDPLTQPAGVKTVFNGSSATSIGGAIYYPNQEIAFSGNTASASDCTMIIADKITMTGGSTMSSSGCEANFGLTTPNTRGTFIVE
jgi:Flp pilus assembly protein TadG